MIKEFKDEYLFLSNFYNCPIYYNGLIFDNAEAAFHAQKTTNKSIQMKFLGMNPSQAKKLGRQIPLRPDWEEVKDDIMYEIVKNKFRNENLKQKLLATGNQELVEGNWWHDNYWGICYSDGVLGLNKLGKILMQVREELKNGVN